LVERRRGGVSFGLQLRGGSPVASSKAAVKSWRICCVFAHPIEVKSAVVLVDVLLHVGTRILDLVAHA
jgi:hypothetical protein